MQLFTQTFAHAAGHLAADGEAAVRVINRAALDQHVLGRHADAPAGGVLAGLDADAIVAGVERAAADDGAAAGFEIQRVAVLRGGQVVDLDIEDAKRLRTARGSSSSPADFET